MICLKDKSTMAISCHLILVVGFLFISFFVNVWFLNNAKSSVKEAATVVHRVSGLKASVSSFSFNSSAFYLFSVFVFFYNHSHCQRHQQHVATLVKCDLCNKKIKKTCLLGL